MNHILSCDSNMEDKVAKAVLIIVFCGTLSSALQTSASTLTEDIKAVLLKEMSNLRGKVEACEDWKRITSSDIEDWKKTTSSDIEDFKKTTSSDIEDLKKTTSSDIEDLKKTTKKHDERLHDIEKGETLEERVDHLEEVCKTKLARTCEELKNYGVQSDGT